MAKYGVRVPPGIACHTPDEVAAAAAKLSGASGEVVVKSQVGDARIRDGGPIGLAENGHSLMYVCKNFNSHKSPSISPRRCSRAAAASGRSPAGLLVACTSCLLPRRGVFPKRCWGKL